MTKKKVFKHVNVIGFVSNNVKLNEKNLQSDDPYILSFNPALLSYSKDIDSNTDATEGDDNADKTYIEPIQKITSNE